MSHAGGGRSRDEGEEEASSFRDLLGEDARPLDRGPERVGPAGGQRRGPSPRREGSARAAFRWPDPDERLRAAAAGVNDATLAALARGEPAPEERIDLHGARRDAAAALLRRRIADTRARGLRCVIVIHGRGRHSATGEAVLREALPGWLSAGPAASHVLAFAPAPTSLGGDGATLVLLRRAE